MEGAKLCHLRDLQKACATMKDEDFAAWVDKHKAWYAPLVQPPKSKGKQKKSKQKKKVPDKEPEPASSESSDAEEETNAVKRGSAAQPAAAQGRGCPRARLESSFQLRVQRVGHQDFW